MPTAGNLVLGLLLQLPAAVAHGGDAGHGGHGGGNSTADMPKDESEYPPSYFAHPEHVGVIYAHITLMVLAWVFVLPVCKLRTIVNASMTSPDFHIANILHQSCNAIFGKVAIHFDHPVCLPRH